MTDKADIACAWAPMHDRLYRDYHDTEWGVPIYDSDALWAKLQLDGMQAGLAWITILRKRETILQAFDGLVPEKLVHWGEADIQRAMQNPGIIRSEAKIRAVIGNARAYLAQRDAGTDFSNWCWAYVDNTPIIGHLKDYRHGPTQNVISKEIAKALKAQGYKFVGPTIVYAWMQAVGLVNDHEIDCPRFEAVQTIVRPS